MSAGRPSITRTALSQAHSPRRFLLLAGFSFSLNLSITAALHQGLGVPAEVAFATALVTVFSVNFCALRWYVFDGGQRRVLPQLLGFALSSLIFRGLEFCGFLLLLRWARTPYLVAAVLALGTSFALKYFVYGGWLFARAPRKQP